MMYVAGPIQSNDEARALETAAFLTEFRSRLSAKGHLPPMILPGG